MLVLRASVYEAILEHAREAAPDEACGLLGGSREGAAEPGTRRESESDSESEPPSATATESRRARNAAPDTELTYAIDPEEQYRLMADFEAAGLELVGFYHSHPRGPAGPSATDHRQAAWPGYHYLIASLGDDRPVLDAWVWNGESFARDPVSVE